MAILKELTLPKYVFGFCVCTFCFIFVYGLISLEKGDSNRLPLNPEPSKCILTTLQRYHLLYSRYARLAYSFLFLVVVVFCCCCCCFAFFFFFFFFFLLVFFHNFVLCGRGGGMGGFNFVLLFVFYVCCR